MSLGEYIGAGASTTKLLLHLNGNSTDSSGNGNNGTDTNITYVDGKFGKCASFSSGSGSLITLPNLNTGTGNFTVSMWINTTSYVNNYRYYYSDTASSSPWNSFMLNYNTTYGLYWGHYNGSSDLRVLIPTLPSTGSWYNIVFIKNGDTGMVYVNGLLVATGSGWLSRNCGENNSHGIGLAGNTFYGKADELIKENRAWSAQEVVKYYTQSRGYYATL